jgi:hypothetical protein
MMKGGERVMKDAGESDAPNPAMWAWNMMAEAAKGATTDETPPAPGKKRGRKG